MAETIGQSASSAAGAGQCNLAPAAERTFLHQATGHLIARLAGCGLGDAGVCTWASGCLLPQVQAFREAGNTVRQADLDLSHNRITDAGLRSLLKAWSVSRASCPLVIKVHFNELTDASLRMLAGFVQEYRGQLRELHLTNNAFASHEAVLGLVRSFASCNQYPIWIRKQRRFAPAFVRLGRCGIQDPGLLSERAQGAARLCFMEARCGRTLCTEAGDGIGSCPLLHLCGLQDQSRATQAASAATSLESAQATGPPETAATAGDRRVASYPCGACGRCLPLDMYGRHQFRKAVAVDALPEGQAAPAHLTRRCNDCVQQPCSACGEELPLSRFAKAQMMRPHGQRRCRGCAAETLLCARCGRPRPPDAYSPVEARKRKVLPRVCSECEQTNPYFERRYVLALVLGSRRPRGPALNEQLPGLPLDILRRIVEFSEPGDEFTRVFQRDFECNLCDRRWSISMNDVDRHVRHSQLHRQRLDKLRKGLLVRIGSLDLDISRFRNGLGIQGAVCSRERAREAQALVRVQDATAQGLALDTLQAAGLAPGRTWAAPQVVELALGLQLGGRAPPEEASCAEVRSAQRRWRLFGHLGAEAEGCDADELSALNAMLSAE
mmetsp:Transcript_46483/g.132535  ORF Transcript_46483/g.132535 Transcript_46483/m.132535 type:complete len:609 (-) Transcript_46483:76-1902(-)